MRRAHQLLVHFGTDKVIGFMEQHFFGFGIARIARDVVASCRVCLATKHYQRATEGAQYFDLPDGPGMAVSLDIFGPLPKTKDGNRYLLVVMDQFSKYTRLYLMENQIIETIMGILQDRYFPEEGLPGAILTDNGGQFRAERWRQFADDSEFEIIETSPYNPQSNPVKRVMREIGRVMRVDASDRHHTWSRIIPRLEKMLNVTVHSSTGFAPDQLHKDDTVRMGLDSTLLSDRGQEDDRQQRIQKAKAKLQSAAEKRKRQFDKTTTARPYQEVWRKVHRQSVKRKQWSKKLQVIYEGPYRINRIVKPNAYELADGDGRLIGTYNSRRLRPHRTERLEEEEEEVVDQVRSNMTATRC